MSENLKKEKRVDEAVKEKTVSYIVAAFGLVAGLAWNEAVKSLIEYIFPSAGNSIMAKIFYAAVLTVVLAAISFYLTKLIKKKKNN